MVQASAYTKYLGDITVYYDENGEVVNWAGAPIYLENSITPGKPENQFFRTLKSLFV